MNGNEVSSRSVTSISSFVKIGQLVQNLNCRGEGGRGVIQTAS